MKKIITLFTCLALILAMIPCGTAFADDTATVKTTTVSASSAPQEVKDFVKSLTAEQLELVKATDNEDALLSLKSQLTVDQLLLFSKIKLGVDTVAQLQAVAATEKGAVLETEDTPAMDVQIVGGWTSASDGTITTELKNAVKEVTKDLVGASYEPVKLVATQVVAGTNYKVLCKATLVTNPPVTKNVYMTLYKDLENEWTLSSIQDVEEVAETSVLLKASSAVKKVNGKKAIKISWTEKMARYSTLTSIMYIEQLPRMVSTLRLEQQQSYTI